MTNATTNARGATRPNKATKHPACCVPLFEDQACFFLLRYPSNTNSFEDMRSLYRDHLTRALAKLIIRFEGPYISIEDRGTDTRRGRRSPSRKTFAHLAQLVARRAVEGYLGEYFSASDYLIFVRYLVELVNDTAKQITTGEFKKNGFYRQIVELKYSTHSTTSA